MMDDRQRRLELLEIATQFFDPGGRVSGSQALANRWSELCPHPGETDLLFWPNLVGLCRDDELSSFQISPSELVEFAMNWEPRAVVMEMTQKIGGASIGYYTYTFEAPGTPETQVSVRPCDDRYELGDTLVVALKGLRLADGTVVAKHFRGGGYSCGELLGTTDQPVGTVIVVPDSR